MKAPTGITPPSPRQDTEEPELAQEHDIPIDDGALAGRTERGRANKDGRDTATPERE
jgi:hypothetical protein